MRLLFQGTWRKERDPVSEDVVIDYFREFADHIARGNHELVIASTRRYDILLAEAVAKAAKSLGRDVKEVITFLLPPEETTIPPIGRVKHRPGSQGLFGDRAYLVQQTDAVVAIGGGKGTADTIQKAFLAKKPVFVACAVSKMISDTWKSRPNREKYHYIEQGDADFVDDLSTTPAEFFKHVFAILDKIAATRFPYRIFLVHGRSPDVRKELSSVLNRLGFEVIVLAEQASQSLTVIEKLERDIERVGFTFIIYTPDDIGNLKGEEPQPRARQNVIFEHGLLSGRLGRDRTCALVIGSGIEFPSDIKGMLYEEFDGFDGKELNDIKRIADILRAAGYRIDASKLI